jgi:hypothetical protein
MKYENIEKVIENYREIKRMEYIIHLLKKSVRIKFLNSDNSSDFDINLDPDYSLSDNSSDFDINLDPDYSLNETKAIGLAVSLKTDLIAYYEQEISALKKEIEKL